MNSVNLIGRLTRDLETKYTQSQIAICRFTLAVDRPVRRDAQPNEPTADFISCVTFGRQAENMQKYLAKGRQIAVEGRIQTESYTNKDGQKIYTTDVIANRVEYLSPSNQSKGDTQPAGSFPAYGAPTGGQQSQPAPQKPAPQPQQTSMDDIPPGFETIDESDIPF